MTIEDLEERGLLLPEERRGQLERRSSTSPVATGVVLVVAAAGCVLMVWGAGKPLTWGGALLFVFALLAFVLQANGAVDRRNRRVDELLADGDDEE